MRSIVSLVLTAVILQQGAAQERQVSEVTCESALRILSESTAKDQRIRAAQELATKCSDDARISAYQDVLRRNRHLDEEEAMLIVYPLSGLRDGAYFADVLELAGDRSAGVSTRMVAFMTLAALRNPRFSPSFEGFSAGLDRNGAPLGSCGLLTVHERLLRNGPTALPNDYVAKIDALVRRVATDPSEPSSMRSAAACT